MIVLILFSRRYICNVWKNHFLGQQGGDRVVDLTQSGRLLFFLQ